jgi:hypothetical protein
MGRWITLLIVFAALLLLRWTYQFFFSRHGRFWRLVAAKPDIALVTFKDHPYCVLDDEPKNPSEYAGPFRFMDSRGERHKVFIAAKHIDGVQARCADTILNVSSQRVSRQLAVADPLE